MSRQGTERHGAPSGIDQIDLDASILRRMRVKTSDKVNVPTVSYKLWPEVIKFLKQCWSDHPTLALTSLDGTPLCEN
jgi:hypothetical protein